MSVEATRGEVGRALGVTDGGGPGGTQFANLCSAEEDVQSIVAA